MNDARRSVLDPGGAAPPWHALPAHEALARTASSADGLSRTQAQQRLAECGPNILPAQPAPGWLAIGLRQLKSPLIYVLLAAAVVSSALGDVTDAAFIGIVLLVNSVIGGWQEWRAERQSQSLQKLLRIRANALRDGERVELDAAELVPGDIVGLESGQLVPADLRLLSTHGLEIAEAALTGESLAVLKDAAAMSAAAAALAERPTMAHAGSLVARGRGLGVVVATGAATAIGRLAIAMSGTQSGQPPLVQRMERFSRTIAIIVLIAAALIGAVGVWVHGDGLATMFVFAVALAVSAIPEGLPVA